MSAKPADIYRRLLPGYKIHDFRFAAKVYFGNHGADYFIRTRKNRNLATFLRLVYHGLWGKIPNFLRAMASFRKGGEYVRHNPFNMVLEPSNVCQLKCPFCTTRHPDVMGKPEFFSLETYKKIMERLGPDLVALQLYRRGEPLLCDYLPEMVKIAKQYRVFTSISTNLNHLPLGMGEELVKSGLDMMIVPFDGASQESYSKYRVGGNFDKVLENLAAVVDARRKLGVNYPFIECQYLVFKHNEHEILKACKMAEAMGCDSFSLRAPADFFDDNKRTSEWQTSFSDITFNGCSDDTVCTDPWFSLHVFSDASCVTCGYDDRRVFSMAKLDMDRFHEAWNNVYFRRARRIAAGIMRGSRKPEPGDPHPCGRCVNIGKFNTGL